MDATESTHCDNCGETMGQTTHRCHTWQPTTYNAPRLRVALYAYSDIDALTKREQSRRDVEQKRKQLRGKRK
jgi:hypothetical protein